MFGKKGAFAEFLIEQMNATEDNSENDEDTEYNAILRWVFWLIYFSNLICQVLLDILIKFDFDTFCIAYSEVEKDELKAQLQESLGKKEFKRKMAAEARKKHKWVPISTKVDFLKVNYFIDVTFL